MKHAFNDLEDSLRVRSRVARSEEPVERLRELRGEMRRVCDESETRR